MKVLCSILSIRETQTEVPDLLMATLCHALCMLYFVIDNKERVSQSRFSFFDKVVTNKGLVIMAAITIIAEVLLRQTSANSGLPVVLCC